MLFLSNETIRICWFIYVRETLFDVELQKVIVSQNIRGVGGLEIFRRCAIFTVPAHVLREELYCSESETETVDCSRRIRLPKNSRVKFDQTT